MKVDAMILAGGEGAIIDPTVAIKGLVPVAGKPMIEWVVDALRAADTIAEIAVVVPSAQESWRLGRQGRPAGRLGCVVHR